MTQKSREVFLREYTKRQHLKTVNKILAQTSNGSEMSEEDMRQVISALSEVVNHQELLIKELSKMVLHLNNRTLVVKKRFWQR